MKSGQITGALTRKAVFVNVTKALNGQVADVTPTTPLEDISRGCWYVSDKVYQCELLVAVEKSIVRGIWEIDKSFGWHPMAMNAIPTRQFKPTDIDPRRQYCQLRNVVPANERNLVGKSVMVVGGFARMCGPVRYNF